MNLIAKLAGCSPWVVMLLDPTHSQALSPPMVRDSLLGDGQLHAEVAFSPVGSAGPRQLAGRRLLPIPGPVASDGP